MLAVAQALQWAQAQLNAALNQPAPVEQEWHNPIDPKVDASWLLAHVIGKNQAWLRAYTDATLTEEHWQQFQQLVQRRCAGEPVAYLTGRQGFWTLDLDVTADTLVPRPATELLVESALTLLDADEKFVVDLGTGSGAIALALASERPNWRVFATDIDAASLELAQRNAHQLHLPITFLQSHWLQDVPSQQFHLIVSNPPYIRVDDPHLQGAGVRFEPLRALVSGEDGLADIREIIATAPQYLFDGGWLLLEHGYDQGAAVRGLLTANCWRAVETRKDLAGNDRLTLASWQSEKNRSVACISDRGTLRI